MTEAPTFGAGISNYRVDRSAERADSNRLEAPILHSCEIHGSADYSTRGADL
jgi:hypothetical protein